MFQFVEPDQNSSPVNHSISHKVLIEFCKRIQILYSVYEKNTLKNPRLLPGGGAGGWELPGVEKGTRERLEGLGVSSFGCNPRLLSSYNTMISCYTIYSLVYNKIFIISENKIILFIIYFYRG